MKTIYIGIIGLFTILSLVNFVAADVGSYGCGMMGNVGGMMYGGYGTGAMLFGWVFSILILVALVLFIVWLVRQIQKPNRR